MSAPVASGRGGIALVAAVYPALSETFVYREALGLAERGWRVCTVGLHPLPEERRAAGVAPADLSIYGSSVPGTLGAAARELVTHPLRSLATLALGLRDALAPGEPTSAIGRVRVFGLAVLALGLAQRLRGRGVDHVHCHFANGPTTLGMYAARQLGLGFSFVGHANDLFDRRSLLRRKLERAAFVSCISEWHRAWYRELCPTAPERYVVIRCGVETRVWAPATARRAASRLRVLAVARLIPKKGIDTLLRALRIAAERFGLEADVTIAGDGPERPALLRLAAELPASCRAQLVGPIPNDAVRAHMAEADVFALPFRTDRLGDKDGISVALMEAMAAELAVVVGDLPTVRELVRDGETGCVVPGDDEAALAAALARLARDPAERARLGAAGRRAVEREFALAPNLDRLDRRLRAELAQPGAEDGAPSAFEHAAAAAGKSSAKSRQNSSSDKSVPTRAE